MKAITLYQPWATLVAIGAKQIETRSWNTAYRGPLAIHAGKNTKYLRGDDRIIEDKYFREAFEDIHLPMGLPLGSIVATCNLVHVRVMDEAIVFPACKSYVHQKREWLLTERERAFGYYAIGRFMWLLDDIQILPQPIPAKGSMGFWEWDNSSTQTKENTNE